MKTSRKIITLLLALVMILSLATSAYARVIDSEENGDGTIIIKNATRDAVYTFYKVFDATVSADGEHIAYTFADPDAWVENDYFQCDSQGNVTATEAAGTDGKLSDGAIEWIKQNGNKVLEVTAQNDTILTVEGLEYGYYYVESTVNNGAQVTVTSTAPTAEVIDKNQIFTGDKYIYIPATGEGQGGQSLEKVNNVSIGEEFTFMIEVNATNYYGDQQVVKYQIKDTLPVGMEFVRLNAIAIADGSLDGNILEEGVDYTYTITNNPLTTNTLDIMITWAEQGEDGSYGSLYGANEVVRVFYVAKLTDMASVGADPNVNTAEIIPYVPNPTPDQPPIVPEGEFPKPQTETYTTALTIHKVDQDGKPLTGAEFTITGERVNTVVISKMNYVEDELGGYWKLKDGTYTLDSPYAEGMDQSKYDSLDKKYYGEQVFETIETTDTITATATVDGTGNVTFKGLGAGTYTITETKTPDGYNTIEPITIRIVFDKETKTFAGYGAELELSKQFNKLSITIENVAGSQLPETGGMGTTLFYALGGFMVLAAVVLLVTKKRMSNAA